MRKRTLAAIAAVCLLAGCAVNLVSVLGIIADWAPFGASVFSGFVAIVAPTNTQLPAEATSISTLIQDVATDAAAAKAAGASSTGVQKVVSAIQAVDGQIPAFESALSAAGLNINSTDQSYISASASLVLATLEGYEATLASTPGTTAASAAVAQLRPVSTPDGCAGFTPGTSAPLLQNVAYTSAHVWANCADAADNFDLEITAAGLVNAKTGVPVKHPPTIANWKRQFNAIAKKYGHPERQMKLSTMDHVTHVFTLGRR